MSPRLRLHPLRVATVAAVLFGLVALAPRGSQPIAGTPAAAPTAGDTPTNQIGLDPIRNRSVREGGSPAPRSLTDQVSLRSTQIGDKQFFYCANGSLDEPPTQVRRVVLVIHGNDRQPCGMANAALGVASAEQRRTTLVIAPRFATPEDRVDRDRHLFWSFYGWSQGDNSTNPGLQLSSYAVLDELIRRLAPRPTVVAGFSGGGQFVNRYAAGSSSEALRFVIANPSSYLYFTRARPGTPGQELERCPGFNNYRYGLDQLNPYMGASGAPGLTARFGRRQVVYLLGMEDRDPRSSSMDKSCGANAEGPNRLERGQRYWAYLPVVFGEGIRTRQRLHLVPGVAHDPVGMFGSGPGRQALFG